MTEFRKETIIKNVNKMIGWELAPHVMGAFNVWQDGDKIIVDVETTDGGVSAIEYSLLLEKARNNKGKVSQEDFIECFH